MISTWFGYWIQIHTTQLKINTRLRHPVTLTGGSWPEMCCSLVRIIPNASGEVSIQNICKSRAAHGTWFCFKFQKPVCVAGSSFCMAQNASQHSDFCFFMWVPKIRCLEFWSSKDILGQCCPGKKHQTCGSVFKNAAGVRIWQTWGPRGSRFLSGLSPATSPTGWSAPNLMIICWRICVGYRSYNRMANNIWGSYTINIY